MNLLRGPSVFSKEMDAEMKREYVNGPSSIHVTCTWKDSFRLQRHGKLILDTLTLELHKTMVENWYHLVIRTKVMVPNFQENIMLSSHTTSALFKLRKGKHLFA